MNEDLMEAINEKMIPKMKADYRLWITKAFMLERFDNGIKIMKGRKYWRIIANGGSAHSFIVAVDDDDRFPRGTILKPNGWKTPTRNFSRGNVLTGDLSRVGWTSAE